MSGAIPDDPHGVGFWVITRDFNGKLIASHVDLGIFVHLVNMQPHLSQLSSYTIQLKMKEGWKVVERIDARGGNICFVPPGEDFRQAYQVKLDTFFDCVIDNKNIEPWETVRGWILVKLEDRAEFSIDTNIPQVKIHLLDTAGVSFQSDPLVCKGKVTNDDAQLPYVLNKGGNRVNLSTYKQE